MDIGSLRQLQTSLSRINDLIRSAVARAEASGSDPTDSLRGLVISADEIAQDLALPAMSALWGDGDMEMNLSLALPPDTPPDLPFIQLLETFDLSTIDAYILLLSLAPDLDRRYERLYAYLQDDISQRRPTINLMMNMLGGNLTQRFAVWERLQADKPLRTHRLIDVKHDNNKPHTGALSQMLKVDSRVVAHLLGDQTPDERLYDSIQYDGFEPITTLDESLINPIYQALPEKPIVYMEGIQGRGQLETCAALAQAYDMPLTRLNASRLDALDLLERDDIWHIALREGYLRQSMLFIDGWHYFLDERHQPDSRLWDALMNYPYPVFISGEEAWEPSDIARTRPMLRLRFEIPEYETRRIAWEEAFNRYDVPTDEGLLDELANKFRFTRTQIMRSVLSATDIATSRGEGVNPLDLYSGAQAHASLKLGHLARRIEPKYDWENLILPPEPVAQLKEIVERARFAHIVQDTWGFGKRISSGGVSALFAGESGTGKTLSAQVIARELGLVLYKIDLSAVVSKYIGETEKNLNTIFTEAHSSNAILFFDEADALFGKRSEVKDARDRYANIEVAYLLQQIEDYDGIAILATNLRQNLDEAFTRRLDFLIDFPFPESEYRRLIWQAHLPDDAPVDSALDLITISERYQLAGGNIRNAALAAAYLAAADGGTITNQHIRQAIRREHQKMGRLLEESY